MADSRTQTGNIQDESRACSSARNQGSAQKKVGTI